MQGHIVIIDDTFHVNVNNILIISRLCRYVFDKYLDNSREWFDCIHFRAIEQFITFQ